MFTEEFKKESDGRTYLLLRKTKESFEEQMIRNVRPAGVLPMVRSEQKDVYKYEVTGRKSLAMTFERVPMNAEQIEKVLGGILDILERGREYLLAEDNYMISPEHIYLRIPDYEVTLCYYPEYNVPFSEQLGKLFEVLLNRVDYREEKAIETVYAMYMQLQEPDMTLERIRGKLREGDLLKPERRRSVASEEKCYDGIPERVTKKTEREKEAASTRISESGEVKKPGLWDRLRKEFWPKRKPDGDRTGGMFSPSPVPCVREEEPDWGGRYTKVLSVKKEAACPALISARDGETIFLSKFPFYVGSLAEYMDYVIEQDTVSRFHAKLIQQGNRVFVADLNSTNGTKVNGRGLTVGEQMPLTNGDRVVFADAEYTYYEKKEEAFF